MNKNKVRNSKKFSAIDFLMGRMHSKFDKLSPCVEKFYKTVQIEGKGCFIYM